MYKVYFQYYYLKIMVNFICFLLIFHFFFIEHIFFIIFIYYFYLSIILLKIKKIFDEISNLFESSVLIKSKS